VKDHPCPKGGSQQWIQMPKSILFVGTDQTLEGEFRSLNSGVNGEWTVEFARNGSEARAISDRTTFSAVVADVQLSDTNGPDLLDELITRFPTCASIVLSEFADTHGTLQCIGKGHHHLSKPCDAETLLRALNGTGTPQVSSPTPAAQGLIAQMRTVPSPPSIYFQVVETIASPYTSVEKVGEIISQDPAIAAKLMQLANSAVFGLQLEVNRPAEAVAYIGLETTQALVLFAHSFAVFDQLQFPDFSVESLWGHSVTTGRFSQAIAQSPNDQQTVADQAFSAGLLHDLGKLLLAANLPEKYSQVLALARERRLSLSEAETEHFGACHAEIGACLLSIWGLPKAIVEAVALHHHPSRLPVRAFTPLTAVHAANVLAHEASAEQSLGCPAEMDREYLGKLGIEAQISDWRYACLMHRAQVGR
jgi:HD-like signal output (HDOD) protein/ActR/RegA family two-component response regulator